MSIPVIQPDSMLQALNGYIFRIYEYQQIITPQTRHYPITGRCIASEAPEGGTTGIIGCTYQFGYDIEKGMFVIGDPGGWLAHLLTAEEQAILRLRT